MGLGGSADQADWLGSKVSGCPTLVLYSTNEIGQLSQSQFTPMQTTHINVVIHC